MLKLLIYITLNRAILTNFRIKNRDSYCNNLFRNLTKLIVEEQCRTQRHVDNHSKTLKALQLNVVIFDAEKTLVDCVKFRNKIGMDVVLEAQNVLAQ